MNKEGDVIGNAELGQELAQAEEQIDYSVLKGLSPNKAGNVSSAYRILRAQTFPSC